MAASVTALAACGVYIALPILRTACIKNMGGDLGYALVVYAGLYILQAKYAMTVELLKLRHLATPKCVLIKSGVLISYRGVKFTLRRWVWDIKN